MKEDQSLGRLVSYIGNKDVPFLRLYRYKEAFSLELVLQLLDKLEATSRDYIFDPFAGMGTTLFAATLRGIQSIGVEKLPLAVFIAQTLPKLCSLPRGLVAHTYNRLLADVAKAPLAPVALDVPLMRIAFTQETLVRLRQWKSLIDGLETPLREAFLLLFFSILEDSSYTSNDGQFLRVMRNKVPQHPDDALRIRVEQMEQDIAVARQLGWHTRFSAHPPKVYLADARSLRGVVLHRTPTILITSPPYCNRYDYTRSYCLPLCFHFVRSFKELRTLRQSILRSHIESRLTFEDYPPHPAVVEVLKALSERRLNNPRIPYMLIGYFVDMEKAVAQWARVMVSGARLAIVVDNVRFEGQMVPVDLILCELGERYGFVTSEIVIARYKGNSSQQMKRYGRMQVRESILIWHKD